MSGRVHKSIMNAEVNLLFFFLSLFFAFISRKIFLECLGAEFIGLTGTLGNILGYLNLAELGIGSCISFFLYKPIQLNDRESINEIMSVFGYLYRCIGYVMLAGGIIISLFLICHADLLMGACISLLNFLFLIGIIFIRRKIGSFAEKRAKFHAEADGVFIDTVTNADLVKSVANYFYEKGRFYHVLRTAVRAEQKERTKDAWFDLEGKTIFYGAYLLSCICVFYWWYRERLDLSKVVLTTSLLSGLMMEVTNIGFFAGEFSQVYGQVKDGLELLFQPCQVSDGRNLTHPV